MRFAVVCFASICSFAAGCRRSSPTVRPDDTPQKSEALPLPQPEFDAATDGVRTSEEAASDAATEPDAAAPSAKRKRFVALPLNAHDHGIDGTFELWRDPDLDDKKVEDLWFTSYRYDHPDGPAAASAQLVLRDARGKIVESLDLEMPLAKLETFRFGDDPIPSFALAIDTYAGMGRWGGTTHRIARIEGGRTRWPCETYYKCALGCGFGHDPRPSGGADLLEWTHVMREPESSVERTALSRVEFVDGRCESTTISVPGWRFGDGPALSLSAFPARGAYLDAGTAD
jgi:hypothetical protein